ncbi:MAG: serine hydrolase [Acidimicrobiales bacterium]
MRNSSASSPSLQWALPGSPVGRQLDWLVAAASHPPVAAAELRAHFDATFLGQVSPKEFNAAIASLHVSGAWRIVTLDAGAAGVLDANVVSGGTRLGVEIAVDSKGLIDGLLVQPSPALPAPPTSWKALEAKLSTLASDVGFEAATLSPRGACTPLRTISPTTARPLGSMFKLFVLGAVAHAVKRGTASWDQPVALEANLTSLPSGVLHVDPAGTKFSLAQFAEIMISSSDNTAADRLAALVGRQAVESQVRAWSAHPSLDTPFLRTRELFVLKYADYPHYADAYLALPPTSRAGYLTRVVDQVPLSAVDISASDLGTPRAIDSIEWFASPSDLCRAFAGLYADAHGPSAAPIAAAMSLNDGGLGLSPTQWPEVWFKGGSETGVLTLGYLARDRQGKVVVVAVQLSDPRKSIDEATVAPELLSILRGAFKLAS